MTKTDDAAQEYMTHTLQKFTYVELTDEERAAAFTLLRALPDATLIKDFRDAINPETVERLGLPPSIADTLKPLWSHLTLNVCYAGQFARLVEPARSPA